MGSKKGFDVLATLSQPSTSASDVMSPMLTVIRCHPTWPEIKRSERAVLPPGGVIVGPSDQIRNRLYAQDSCRRHRIEASLRSVSPNSLYFSVRRSPRESQPGRPCSGEPGAPRRELASRATDHVGDHRLLESIGRTLPSSLL